MFKALDKELFHCILQLKTFLKRRELKAPGISIEQYNQEINDAIARVEAGEFYTHDDVESMAKEW